jgi:hypothetical protein
MEKLREAIRRYLSFGTGGRTIGSAKGRITKLVNESAAELGVGKARELALTVLALVLAEGRDVCESRVETLKNRFNPKSLYREGDRVFGWYDPEMQVQAEELPLYYNDGAYYYYVSFYRRSDDYSFWRSRGFEAAEDLPTIQHRDGLEVKFDVKRSLFWLEHGYALPCKLPWHRGRFDGQGTDECLWVSRSIIPAGWWCAWKWWEGCQWWYYERHPEWFTDMDWWGTYDLTVPIRYEPIDDPYAAVLGGMR